MRLSENKSSLNEKRRFQFSFVDQMLNLTLVSRFFLKRKQKDTKSITLQGRYKSGI